MQNFHSIFQFISLIVNDIRRNTFIATRDGQCSRITFFGRSRFSKRNFRSRSVFSVGNLKHIVSYEIHCPYCIAMFGNFIQPLHRKHLCLRTTNKLVCIYTRAKSRRIILNNFDCCSSRRGSRLISLIVTG